MAICVREVCPKAELYIGRLDDSHQTDPNQKFSIESCTKALQWALDQGVDIISMSWTYEMTPDDNRKTEFESKVRDVIKNDKAVLFGSLPDLGVIQPSQRFSPIGLEGVIKISPAKKSGAVSDENLHQKSDFLFPGENKTNMLGKEVRGSSFATASAAGLAALVIYTIKALAVAPRRTKSDIDTANNALYIAKNWQGLKRIFEIMSMGKSKEDSKVGPFVRPSQTLVISSADIEDDDTVLGALRRIVGDLVPGHVKRDLLPVGLPSLQVNGSGVFKDGQTGPLREAALE
ncbi:hypothetical protein B0H67DRAFT_537788 [Lasiosphaeris hirsuta]|uniref:Peptidase S8/S53 domain-containing protein n=1 Tax=Lasiosphaeris hirsuta TaxID=260670 RepID=A0AA40AGH4_9PEZI|nr:hypothetical protein B0H67DRAFT_537788 [Lasiosphaeris hirsuta]